MLLALAALGAAILAVVLACLAIITPTMDGPYRQILDAAGGVRAAMAPYLHIATIGGAASVVAVLGAMAWPALSAPIEVVTLSIAALLGVWCVAGVVGLTALTLFHAEQRAELQKAIDNAETLHAEQLERPPG